MKPQSDIVALMNADAERMRKKLLRRKAYLWSTRFFLSLFKRKRFPRNLGQTRCLLLSFINFVIHNSKL